MKSVNQQFGVTIVVITHEMKVIEQICHRVAVIDQSRIVELGTVQEVFIRPKSAIARELILPTAASPRRSRWGGAACASCSTATRRSSRSFPA